MIIKYYAKHCAQEATKMSVHVSLYVCACVYEGQRAISGVIL